MITGKTLIDLGYKPDKWFREAHVEATGVDMQDLIESGYFDEEES